MRKIAGERTDFVSHRKRVHGNSRSKSLSANKKPPEGGFLENLDYFLTKDEASADLRLAA